MNWFRMIDLPGNSCRFDGIVPEFGIGSVLKGGGNPSQCYFLSIFLIDRLFFFVCFFLGFQPNEKKWKGEILFFSFSFFFVSPGNPKKKKEENKQTLKKKKEKILEKKNKQTRNRSGFVERSFCFFFTFF